MQAAWNQWASNTMAQGAVAAPMGQYGTQTQPAGNQTPGVQANMNYQQYYAAAAAMPTLPTYTAEQWAQLTQDQQTAHMAQWHQQQAYYVQWQQMAAQQVAAQQAAAQQVAPPLPPTTQAAPPPLPAEDKKRPSDDKTDTGASKKQKTDEKGTKSETLEDLLELRKSFDTQFTNWEAEYFKWKEANANHPDQAQKKEYEAKWSQWREQLLHKRDVIDKKIADKKKLIEEEKKIEEETKSKAANAWSNAYNALGNSTSWMSNPAVNPHANNQPLQFLNRTTGGVPSQIPGLGDSRADSSNNKDPALPGDSSSDNTKPLWTSDNAPFKFPPPANNQNTGAQGAGQFPNQQYPGMGQNMNMAPNAAMPPNASMAPNAAMSQGYGMPGYGIPGYGMMQQGFNPMMYQGMAGMMPQFPAAQGNQPAPNNMEPSFGNNQTGPNNQYPNPNQGGTQTNQFPGGPNNTTQFPNPQQYGNQGPPPTNQGPNVQFQTGPQSGSVPGSNTAPVKKSRFTDNNDEDWKAGNAPNIGHPPGVRDWSGGNAPNSGRPGVGDWSEGNAPNMAPPGMENWSGGNAPNMGHPSMAPPGKMGPRFLMNSYEKHAKKYEEDDETEFENYHNRFASEDQEDSNLSWKSDQASSGGFGRGPEDFKNDAFNGRENFNRGGPGFNGRNDFGFGPNAQRDGRNSFGPNGPRDGRDNFGPNGPRDGNFGPNGPRDGNFGPNGPRDGNFGPNRPRDVRDSFGPNGPRDGRDSFGPNGPRDGRDSFGPNGPRDGRGSLGPNSRFDGPNQGNGQGPGSRWGVENEPPDVAADLQEVEEKPRTCIIVEYNHRKIPAAMSIELVKGYNEPYKGPVFVYEYSHGANKKFFRQRAASPSLGRRRSPLRETNPSPIKRESAENPARVENPILRANSREEFPTRRESSRYDRDRRSPPFRDRSPERRIDRERRSPDRRDRDRLRRNRDRSPPDARHRSPDDRRLLQRPPVQSQEEKDRIASRLSDLENRLAEERRKYEQKSRFVEQKKIAIDDLLEFPGRETRPGKIVIFLRGPPCSGKSFLAKIMKDKEAQNGNAQNMRILSLDDYFMTKELEREIVDERGLKKKVKAFEYEYDSDLEEAYRQSLAKSFKKHINDAYFSFIIVDACNDQLRYYADMYLHAKGKGFAVFIAETTRDAAFCLANNIRDRDAAHIEEIIAKFQPTPKEQILVDLTSLLQGAEIEEVEMEDAVAKDSPVETVTLSDDDGDIVELENTSRFTIPSKWDNVETNMGEFKAKLDGLRKPVKSLQDWLEDGEVDTSLYGSVEREKGKKRVRWADIEEKLEQDKMKAIGFVVGNTDWNRMMDPESGARQLNRTKYI